MQSRPYLISNFLNKSPLHKIQDALYEKHGVKLYIKRDDLLHPQWGGNKARKLYNHVLQFLERKNDGWVSWGGPWSNHLHAFAAFSYHANIPFHVIIRGRDFSYCPPLFHYIYNRGLWGENLFCKQEGICTFKIKGIRGIADFCKLVPRS